MRFLDYLDDTKKASFVRNLAFNSTLDHFLVATLYCSWNLETQTSKYDPVIVLDLECASISTAVFKRNVC